MYNKLKTCQLASDSVQSGIQIQPISFCFCFIRCKITVFIGKGLCEMLHEHYEM